MKKVIITDAPNGYSVSVVTEGNIDVVWGIDGGLLKDAITSAIGVAEEVGADNAGAWAEIEDEMAQDKVAKVIKSKPDSCEEYRWGFDPAENRDALKKVINRSGRVFDIGYKWNWDAIVQQMDDDIREALCDEGFETEQEFLAAYETAHEEKFGEEWELSKENPVW